MSGAHSPRLVAPPRVGADFADFKVGRKSLLVSADPITGVSSNLGWYAVNVSANDIATSGNAAQFLESVILLPPRSTEEDVSRLARQIDGAAREIGAAVVGGHTELTPGLTRPVVVVTAFSVVDRYVTSGGAAPGESILVTKTAGIEGTAALARERGGRMSSALARRCLGMERQMSVTREALAAFATGDVTAMHDCTEGGVLGAAFEMSLASGLGFELEESAVPVATQTSKLCQKWAIDPLKLIGSGALLLAVEKGKERDVSKALSPLRVSGVGTFTKSGRVLVRKDGARLTLREAPEDELWRALARTSGRRYRL